MRYATAVRRLRQIAEDAHRVNSGAAPLLLAVYTFGPLLEHPAEVAAVDIALVCDAPAGELCWRTEPPWTLGIAEVLRLNRAPVRWYFRPATWPVSNHLIREPLQILVARGGRRAGPDRPGRRPGAAAAARGAVADRAAGTAGRRTRRRPPAAARGPRRLLGPGLATRPPRVRPLPRDSPLQRGLGLPRSPRRRGARPVYLAHRACSRPPRPTPVLRGCTHRGPGGSAAGRSVVNSALPPRRLPRERVARPAAACGTGCGRRPLRV